jgi:hypothetical protein
MYVRNLRKPSSILPLRRDLNGVVGQTTPAHLFLFLPLVKGSLLATGDPVPQICGALLVSF